MRAETLTRRVYHRRPMSRLPVLVVLLACALAFACGNDGDDESAAATPTPAESEAGCARVEEPAPKEEGDLPRPKERLERGKTYVATVSTNCGDFDITLDSRRAPRTGGSFKSLADRGFYDGTIFHRIVPGFVIQGGDPQGTGQGGPGYSVVEAPPQDLKYGHGVVAMAKTELEEAGTSGSQFFVVTAEDAQLPPDYALVGRVTSGQDVVDTIATVRTDPATERPVEPVVIESIDVRER
jgi:peptidyl-prolyl cis-trans isomerase B (cyclophilin B)